MRLNVFGHNTPALRLYESLGYTVASASMTARIDELPDASPGGPRVELRPMTAQEFAVFRPHLEEDYGANIAAAGGMPEPEARRKAAADLDELLPSGPPTPGHLIWTAFDGTDPVGHLWLQLQPRSDGLHAFGFEFAVREDLRRRGYGRAVAAAAQRACRERGVRSVGLSVFGFNTGARSSTSSSASGSRHRRWRSVCRSATDGLAGADDGDGSGEGSPVGCVAGRHGASLRGGRLPAAAVTAGRCRPSVWAGVASVGRR